MTLRLLPVALLLAVLTPLPAHADKVIWQYDDLPGDMNLVATGLKQHPVYAQPGFIGGEAFGQIFRPTAADYPVHILSVELVMAQPDGAPANQKLSATIEIWNDAGDGPSPNSGLPLWSINTDDFANGGTIGMPIVGNTAMIYQFDWSKPEGHPPEITSGNIWVMIRVKEPAQDLAGYWGKLECTKLDLGDIGSMCGCSKLASLADQKTTLKANVVNIVWPLGKCSGNKSWQFAEQLTNSGGFTMTGDFLLRLGVEGTSTPIVTDAGSTGGADTTDTADMTDSADAGSTAPDVSAAPDVQADVPAVPAVVLIDSVLPSQIPAMTATEIEVDGKNFATGATVKLISAAASDFLSNVKVEASGLVLHATVVGLPAGVYDLKITNPNGLSAVKAAALTLLAPTDSGTTDAGSLDTAAPAGEFSLGTVDPKCIETAADTQVTLYGSGFVKGMTVRIGTTQLASVDVAADGHSVKALALKGMTAGKYSVFAELPDGSNKALANAIQVGQCSVPTVAGSAASGCSSLPVPVSRSGWLALLLVAGVLVLRRRMA